MALFRRGTTKTEAPILPMGIGNVHTAVNTKHLRQKLIDIGETRDGERAEVSALYAVGLGPESWSFHAYSRTMYFSCQRRPDNSNRAFGPALCHR